MLSIYFIILYICLPHLYYNYNFNNLIIQWGKVTNPIYNTETGAKQIVLPYTYSQHYISLANGLGTSNVDGSGINSMYTYQKTLSNFWILNDGDISTTHGANWITIGY